MTNLFSLKSMLRYTCVHFAWWRIKQYAAYAKWALQGKPEGVPPQLYKMQTLVNLAKSYRLNLMIETGTLYGESSAYAAARGLRVITIELAPHLYQLAVKRFKNQPRVQVLQGDSGHVLPEILKTLNEPALFWLDGHFSAADTASGIEKTPIAREIAAIAKHKLAKQHVVLIDDAHSFALQQDNYPPLDEFLALLKKYFPSAKIETRHNLIRVMP